MRGTHTDLPGGLWSRSCAEPRGLQGGQAPAPAALGGAADLGQEPGIAGLERECESGWVGAPSCSASAVTCVCSDRLLAARPTLRPALRGAGQAGAEMAATPAEEGVLN